MTTTRPSWADLQREEDEKYTALLDQFDPDRIGMRIVCPGCGGDSWLTLPAKRGHGRHPLTVSCPRACGTYGLLAIFSPSACARADAGDFDLSNVCRNDGAEIATNGAIFRCPMCAIENPRAIMNDLKTTILKTLTPGASTDACSDLVAKVMSTFDGVMRASNRIAVSNAIELKQSHPVVTSFQNVAAARDKLLPGWDMAKPVSDWPRFVLIVQKRHLFAHTLGVADQDYIRKSGDASTPPGKKVKLTADDVSFFATAAEQIVIHYFGYYLS